MSLIRRSFFVATCACLIALPKFAFGVSGDQKTEGPAPQGETKTLHGKVVRFVHSPKGPYEGVLLQNGEAIFQVVFPKELSAEVTKATKPGESLTAVGTTDEAKGYHLVFKAKKLTSATGAAVQVPVEAEKDHVAEDTKKDDTKKPAEEKPKTEPSNEPQSTLTGTVKFLNYAKHGEANGVVLENGDFIHLKPHGAQALKVAVGQKISATGVAQKMPSGGTVIEHPAQVNGKPLPEKPGEAPKTEASKPAVDG